MSQNGDPIVIVGMARTAMGGFQGALAPLTAPQLGAAAIGAALARAGVAAEDLDEVIMGCVLAAGQGQAPARQASFGAGVPDSVGCTTINKMCGSGMKAAMLVHDLIAAGSGEGSGLGLAIARETMRLHGGDIELVETGATGTRFRLTLPD